MNPLSLNPLALMAGAVLSIAIGFGGGWTVNGWRLGADLSELKAQHAEERAVQAQGALADLATAAAKIHAAADQYAGIQTTLGTKLEQLRKEFQNAKPLPVNCRPDDFRLRHLKSAVDATNEAAAR
jgi:hypothetical protein